MRNVEVCRGVSRAACRWTVVACAVFLLSCSTNITQHSEAAHLQMITDQADQLLLRRDATVQLRSGYRSLRLKQGTIWRPTGDIPQGRVYEAVNSVLQVRTGHAHEVHLVIDHEQLLVGVYLPVEQAFVACRNPQTLDLTEQIP